MNDYIVIASDNIQDLTGTGMELLTDKQGNVIAVFYNGSMNITNPAISVELANEATKSVA